MPRAAMGSRVSHPEPTWNSFTAGFFRNAGPNKFFKKCISQHSEKTWWRKSLQNCVLNLFYDFVCSRKRILAVLQTPLSCSERSLFSLKTCSPVKATPEALLEHETSHKSRHALQMLSAPKSRDPLRLRRRFSPLPRRIARFLRPQDARFPLRRKSLANGDFLCDLKGQIWFPLRNSLRYLSLRRKSLANGDARFWCTQLQMCHLPGGLPRRCSRECSQKIWQC